ncbi:MAG: hypothetical protein AAFY56_13155 [Pseudomonadota bacterium]
MSVAKLATDLVPKLLFLLGFGVLCMLFGMASVRFELFPYPQVREAWSAARAVRTMLLEPGDTGWTSGDGVKRRFDVAGVTRHDPAQALEGFTLYSSWHAPEAILVDMAGTIAHQWSLPFSTVLAATPSDRDPVPDAEVILRQARLLPDGDLMAIYERPDHTPYGWGLARYAADGSLRWAVIEHLHHDFAMAANGGVVTLGQVIQSRKFPGLDAIEAPFSDEFVVVISPEGEVIDRLSLFEAFANSPFKAA